MPIASTRGESDAEDLTSQIFVRALDRIVSYRGGSVRAWLFRIAHNCTVDYWRAQRPQISLEHAEIDLPAAEVDFVEHRAQKEQVQALQLLLAEPNDEETHILMLRLVSGLNASEIAQIVRKNAVSVRVGLHRTLRRLRESYERITETKAYSFCLGGACIRQRQLIMSGDNPIPPDQLLRSACPPILDPSDSFPHYLGAAYFRTDN